ncbi:MAG: hypothetical protein IJ874_01245 [Ruminococcus sp.]|nr:hypothetical protein [Ruminococcus sp.]
MNTRRKGFSFIGFLKTIAVIIAVLVISVIITSIPPSGRNYAQGFSGDASKSGIADEKGLFTAQEKAALDAEIQAEAEYLQMNIVVYLGGIQRSEYATEIFADDEYDEYFGEDTDGVFYYMDLSGKSTYEGAYDYISTSGRAWIMYQERIGQIYSLLDNYLPTSSEVANASFDYSQFKDNIYNGIGEFIGLLGKYSDGSYESSYYHDQSSGKYIYRISGKLYITKSKPPAIKLMILLLGELIGLIVGLIVYFSVKSTYKFKSKTNPSVYIARNETAFERTSDIHLRTNVTKHRIETDSGGGRSGGGGGGGHSHSGGHGGGGHHR